ncbi:MAG: P1 family peptidase [Hyphomicrobiaceae bacterium]|nr:P1 family peptidase [Hyphomicrobiaceae bacterium]
MADDLNLITDVPGLKVGHAEDPRVATGVTVILVEGANVASGVVRGGAPGGRDIGLLEPEMTVEAVNAVVLSGGSLFGLDATGGVVSFLRERGIGHRIASACVPIVCQAIVFDLLNGGDKDWGRMPPYWELGYQAAAAAAPGAFALGTAGGGWGATTATLKGGVGSASAVTASGFRVGAIAVVNAVGSAVVGEGPHFWAAPFERGSEFGGLGAPPRVPAEALRMRIKGGAPPSTTIALVATDAVLSKAQAKRVAHMADDGLARALRPTHAPMDGDTVIALATLQQPLRNPAADITEIGLAAGDCLARAIARGVYEATALSFPGAIPAWRDRFAPGAG